MASPGTTPVDLPDTLLEEMIQAAQAQSRPVSEVLAEAVRGYLDDRSWRKLIQGARERTKAMGLTEEDVPRLIAESRAEHGHDR